MTDCTEDSGRRQDPCHSARRNSRKGRGQQRRTAADCSLLQPGLVAKWSCLARGVRAKQTFANDAEGRSAADQAHRESDSGTGTRRRRQIGQDKRESRPVETCGDLWRLDSLERTERPNHRGQQQYLCQPDSRWLDKGPRDFLPVLSCPRYFASHISAVHAPPPPRAKRT